MSTISDVAKRAGVSAMTVSRVVNGTGYTSVDTRTRVEAAIEELGYVPNALARQLRSKRTKTIALVVSDISNPFFTTIARGVEDYFVDHGFSVMYCNTDEDEAEEEQYLLMLIERQVDGVLLVPARSSGESFRLLNAHHRARGRDRPPDRGPQRGQRPLRFRGRGARPGRAPGRAGPSADRRADGPAHDLDLGRSRRRRAPRPRGRGAQPSTTSSSTTAASTSARATRRTATGWPSRCSRQPGEPPTAVFCANNFIAFGAIRALHEAGLRVPDDMSVVAFDDLPEEWVAEPFLTVAAQPAYDIGNRAATLLLAHIAGSHEPTGESIVLPFELIIRRSSGPPRVPAQEASA